MAKPSERVWYFWSDRQERAFVLLRYDLGHWRVEWGYRDPPGSENTVQTGEHATSNLDEATQWMIRQIERLSPEPDEARDAIEKFRAAMAARQA
ncbi:MAG: hypothetical protein C4290_01735 [Chloroflexota bacterium]